jgi:hypothetical protein
VDVFGCWLTPRRWDDPSSDGLYLYCGTCNTKVYLGPTLCLDLDLNNRLLGGNLFWGCTFCFRFLAMEVLNFSSNFSEAHIHLNQCYGLACVEYQNLMCSLCSCCTWQVLNLHSCLWFFFVGPTCESVAHPIN